MGDGDGGNHLACSHRLVVVRRLKHPAREAHLTLFEGEPEERDIVRLDSVTSVLLLMELPPAVHVGGVRAAVSKTFPCWSVLHIGPVQPLGQSTVSFPHKWKIFKVAELVIKVLGPTLYKKNNASALGKVCYTQIINYLTNPTWLNWCSNGM